jgi:DNA-binding LytR/AlgR family response regulator
MYKIAIVEDEKNEMEKLLSFAKRYAEESGNEFVFLKYDNGVDFLNSLSVMPDIVFMDIEMPEMNGFEAAKKLRGKSEKPVIVFVTNLMQYAVAGYEVEAMDYILKPASYLRVASVMSKAISKIKFEEDKEIIIKVKEGLRTIKESELMYVEIRKHLLTFHTTSGNFDSWGKLNSIEDELPPERFFKGNNCYLINASFVKGIDGDCALIKDERLKLSSSHRKEFIAQMALYLGKSE